MYLAYDALDNEMKEKISDLRAFIVGANRRNTGNDPATEEERRFARP